MSDWAKTLLLGQEAKVVGPAYDQNVNVAVKDRSEVEATLEGVSGAIAKLSGAISILQKRLDQGGVLRSESPRPPATKDGDPTLTVPLSIRLRDIEVGVHLNAQEIFFLIDRLGI